MLFNSIKQSAFQLATEKKERNIEEMFEKTWNSDNDLVLHMSL